MRASDLSVATRWTHCADGHPRGCTHRLCRIAADSCAPIRRERQLTRGERIAERRDGGISIRTVCSGLAAICAALPDGRRQIVYLATPGDPLLPCDEPANACWMEALAPTLLCELDLSAANGSLTRNSVLLDALLELSRHRLAAATLRVITLGRTDGSERVAGFLADMTRRLGSFDGQRWRVHLPLSREDIADYLGLNAETVSRILSRVKRQGLVEFKSPTEFEVPDLERLASRSPVHAHPQIDAAAAKIRLAGNSTPEPTPEQVAASAKMSEKERNHMIRGMVDGLAARLQRDPADIDAWLMLIRSYAALQERDLALNAARDALNIFNANEDRSRVLRAAAEHRLVVN